MNAQNGVVAKKCVNKFCRQSDITDFSTCRYCGERYDGVSTRYVDKPSLIEQITSNPLKLVSVSIFVLTVVSSVAVAAMLPAVNSDAHYHGRRGGIPSIPAAFILYFGGKMATNANNNVQAQSEILSKDPTNYDALVGRGDSHYTRLEMSQALNDYTAAVNAHPEKRAAYEKRALIYDAMGSYNLAKNDRDAAAGKQP